MPTRCLASIRRSPACAAALVTATVVAHAAAAPPTIERLDPALAAKDTGGEWAWHDARQLTVEGRGWDDTERFYDRLPGRAKATVRDAVWRLARHAAGIAVRFRTDSDRIAARWTLTHAELAMPHMPATGVSGLDLYVRDGTAWRWIGTGRPSGTTSQATLAKGIPAAGDRDYLLFLPLYNGVESLEIGTAPAATPPTAAARPPDRAAPIVFYGTSITQGGCASRPGMAYPAILGRRLDRPVVNLGFSGNGRLEAEVGALIAEVDAAAYVLDCGPNMTVDMVSDRTVPFVVALRAARPATPIVLVGTVAYPAGAILPASRAPSADKNAALAAAIDRLTALGVAGLSHVPGDALLGTDGEDTVDGTHPTDLGFLRMADALEPTLRRVLDAGGPPAPAP
ncbi:MAG: SGNH/GDSL hydrolase family protein [Planctomycetaceae bacterium]